MLATDPLLSRLTPAAIREMANDYEVGFTPEERAWSLRAAEGIVRVGEWLREVEGWGIAWGRGKGGVGYLPPEPGKRRKRRLTAKEDGMKTIEEEVKTLEEPTTNNRAGRPMTPMQLRMQRKAAAENDPSTPVRTKTLSHPNDTESEEDYEDIDESEEYLGSLPKSTVLRYEARIEDITDQVEELDVEGLKGKVLCKLFSPPCPGFQG